MLIDRAIELGRAGHVKQAVGVLRPRLILDPGNMTIRTAIEEIYRAGGHPDQAARYMLGFREFEAAEFEPYLQALARTGADEERIRKLSVLPHHVPVPDEALQRIEEIRAANRAQEPWETMAWSGGLLFLVAALITVVVVYFVVLLDGDFARPVAAIGGAVATGFLALCTLGIAGSSWKKGARRSAVLTGLVFLASATAFVLAIVAIVA